MVQANSVDAYLRILTCYWDEENCYYRGQLEKNKYMPSSISREPDYAANESKIYQDAVSLGAVDLKGLVSPIERLAKLQHYGIPTRLVDVTIDPLVALYFAVENVNDNSAGNVYLYQVDGYSMDSEEVKVLSLLPTIDHLTKGSIASEYEKQFGGSISDEEISCIVNSPVIVRYSEVLQKSNPRLYNQKGTFLICGNVVEGDTITSSLKSLDTYTPTLVIRIPFEYKKAIKDDLDNKYNVNHLSIYPELPSVATYIKEKYKKKRVALDGVYSIVKEEDVSTGVARRISVTVVLNKQLAIDQIKQISINVMQKYQKYQDVVWLYVARTGDDYITYNWFLRGQWINPKLDSRFRPMTLEVEDDGYYWDCSKSYSITADYFTDKGFDDDNLLYIKHKKIWEQFVPVYTHLLYSFKSSSWDGFVAEVMNKEKEVGDLYRRLQDFKLSHDKDFDDFLATISSVVGLVDDLHILIENRENNKLTHCMLNRRFDDVSSKIEQIDQGFSKWQAKGEAI